MLPSRLICEHWITVALEQDIIIDNLYFEMKDLEQRMMLKFLHLPHHSDKASMRTNGSGNLHNSTTTTMHMHI